MKKPLLVFICFLFLCSLCFGGGLDSDEPIENAPDGNKFVSKTPDRDFEHVSFDFVLGSSIILGEAHELVFENKQKLSDLRWPLYPAVSVYANIDFEVKQGFHLDFAGTFCPQIIAGKMTDYDYETKSKNFGKRIHESIHPTLLKHHFFVDGFLGWKFRIYGTDYLRKHNFSFFVEPAIGIGYGQWSWEAWNGSGVYYGSPVTFDGLQIDFKVRTLIPKLGVNLYFDFHKNVRLSTGLHISPYYSSESLDRHFARNKYFHDQFHTQGVGTFTNLKVKWKFSKYFGLFSKLDYNFWLNKNGETDIYDISEETKTHLGDGASGQTMQFGSITLGLFFNAKL